MSQPWVSFFDEKENNYYFSLSIKVVEPVLIVSSPGPVNESLPENSARTQPLKYFCPYPRASQNVKGCDSSLEGDVLSGVSCSSLLMADWSSITVLVTCTLYQPMVLH